MDEMYEYNENLTDTNRPERLKSRQPNHRIATKLMSGGFDAVTT